MKNKIISIILLSASLSLTGCGTQQASVEPTESVVETETEEVAVETETPPTDYNALYPGFSSENITINEDGTKEYSEAFYDQCKNYKCFEGATHEEIAKTVDMYFYNQKSVTPQEYNAKFVLLDAMKISAKGCLDNNTDDTTTNTATSDTDKSSTQNTTEPSTPSTSSQPTEVASNDAPADTTYDESTDYDDSNVSYPTYIMDDGLANNVPEHQWEETPEVESEPTHLSEDFGYSVGSSFTRSGVTLTYIGNDEWKDQNGETWYAYLFPDGSLHWTTGLK